MVGLVSKLRSEHLALERKYRKECRGITTISRIEFRLNECNQ
jgi:hypothetical protein